MHLKGIILYVSSHNILASSSIMGLLLACAMDEGLFSGNYGRTWLSITWIIRSFFITPHCCLVSFNFHWTFMNHYFSSMELFKPQQKSPWKSIDGYQNKITLSSVVDGYHLSLTTIWPCGPRWHQGPIPGVFLANGISSLHRTSSAVLCRDAKCSSECVVERNAFWLISRNRVGE